MYISELCFLFTDWILWSTSRYTFKRRTIFQSIFCRWCYWYGTGKLFTFFKIKDTIAIELSI